MDVERVKKFIKDLREMDAYNVEVDVDGYLYVERNIDGPWVNVYSLECLIDEFEDDIFGS